VDQFEEIYSLCEDRDKRRAFVGNLLYAAGERSRYVSAICTFRSDFLGETHKNSQLNHLFAEQGVLVPAMGEDELRDAIREPAQQAGRELDPYVVDKLIEQTEDRDGALPLLQFALTRIWDGMNKGVAAAQMLEHDTHLLCSPEGQPEMLANSYKSIPVCVGNIGTRRN